MEDCCRSTPPARLLGYEVDELLKVPMRELVAPEFRAQFDQYLEKISANGSDQGLLCVLTKDGQRRIWEYRNTLRTDGVASPLVRGLAHGVTERKLAEDALRRSEQRMRLFIEHAPAGAALLDREMRYVQASRRWREDYGLGDRDLIGISHYEIFPEIPERWKEAHRRCLAGETLREERDCFERADGRVQCVRWELHPWYEKGQIGGIAIFAEDVTARELAADALLKSEERYRMLFEKTVAGVGIISVGGTVLDCNDACEKSASRRSDRLNGVGSGGNRNGEGVGGPVYSCVELKVRQHVRKTQLRGSSFRPARERTFRTRKRSVHWRAVIQKLGRIELADKGTLFLDEIGEMPPELQPKLLRVLQDREFERLGGVRTLHVDVRIISATNRDLRQDVADRNFREDLFYRLNVFPIELPPLRDRRDDIPMLVQHFINKHSARMGRPIDSIPDDAMRILRSWNWPGNVRELENVIERMVIMSKGATLAAPPAELSEAEFAAEDNLTDMEREHILRVLRETNGVLSGNGGAASRLGLKRPLCNR